MSTSLMLRMVALISKEALKPFKPWIRREGRTPGVDTKQGAWYHQCLKKAQARSQRKRRITRERKILSIQKIICTMAASRDADAESALSSMNRKQQKQNAREEKQVPNHRYHPCHFSFAEFALAGNAGWPGKGLRKCSSP